MDNREILKRVCAILNIELTATNMEEMMNDIASIVDNSQFIPFVKTRFNYERYRYLTGYQRFISLVNDYKKEFAPRLNEEQHQLAYAFADKVFKHATFIFDEIHWLVQCGEDLHSKKIDLIIYNAFNDKPKELQVLKQVGNRDKIYHLCLYSKESLRLKIEDIVHNFTMQKHYPQLANKSNDKLLIEKLKGERQ